MRLNRQPCVTCAADTIHKGPMCLACNTVAPMPSVTRRQKHRKRIASLIVTRGKRAALEQLGYERRRSEYLASMDRKNRGVRHVDRPLITSGRRKGSTQGS